MFAKAIKFFAKVIKLELDFYMTYYWRGMAFYRTGKLKKLSTRFKSCADMQTTRRIICQIAIIKKQK